jgi:hypothetical protein
MSNLSQIEACLGTFSEFLRLTQAYHLTWCNIYYILTSTLTPDERQHIWQSAQEHADQLYSQNLALNPVADETVPSTEPNWANQLGKSDPLPINHMVAWLLKGMKENAHTQVNYDKIREIAQGAEEKPENPAFFMAHLTEAITKYTNLNLTSPAGTLFLHVQFISQSAPNI